MNLINFKIGILWILYCFLHSLLATLGIKKRIELVMGEQYKYYRLIYSVFAAITLLLLLWVQFTSKGTVLFNILWIKYIAVFLFIIPGIVIMAITIRKYFYELSGIQPLNNEQLHTTLQVKGLHRYMRHPLYSGTLLFIWGLFLIMPLDIHLTAACIITIYVLVGIVLEEKKLLIEFGNDYTQYAKKVKKLLPYIY